MTTATESTRSTRDVPGLTGFQHLGLTVRDVEASEAWYGRVLGLERLFVEPHATGSGYAVVMTRPGTGLFLGLDHHPDADRERFDPRRTGLDHLAIQVEDREDIDAWVAHFDGAGVRHGEVFLATEPVPRAQVVCFDPDGIPIELFWMGG